ncbi:MAG: cupin domain-containing protein [Candidatus Bathyarchaeia archaeon]
MSFKVIRLKDVETEQILGGPIKPVVNPRKVGSKNLVFALGVFNPGEGLVPHIHPQSEEVYYVIKGKGTVYVGEEKKETPIEPEVALYIPPGTIHAVTNTGKEKLLIAFFVAPGREPSEVIDK